MASFEDVDQLFGDSAERRLVEHERAALGHAPRAPVRRAIEGGAIEDAERPRSGAAVTLDVTARPDRDVIPGALVTVAVRVQNGGSREAADVTLHPATPVGATLRAGSLRVDGSLAEADGGGIPLGTLAAAQRRTVSWQLVVDPGVEPIFVGVAADAPGAGVVGTPGAIVRRRRSRGPSEPVRPFYELDDHEEHLESDPVQPGAERPAAVIAPAAPPAQPPAPPPLAEAPPPVVPSAHVLYAEIGAPHLRVLRALFAAGTAPFALAHHLLVELLACRLGADGADPSGLDGLLARDIAGLTRALVSARTGRPASAPAVAAAEIERLRFRAPATGEPPRVSPGGLLLRAALEPGPFAALETTARGAAPPLLRLRQLAIRLAAREVVGGDAATAAALAAYDAAAAGWVARLVVRSAVDRRLDVMAPAPPALHESGRALVTRFLEIAS